MCGIRKQLRPMLLAAFAGAAALVCAPAKAQNGPAGEAGFPVPIATQLRPGDVVRVRLGEGPRQEGTVVRSTADSLVLALAGDGGMLPVALTAARRVELRRGDRPRGTGLMRGAGIGLLAGAAFGGVVGAVTYEEPDRSDCTGGWEDMFCGVNLGGPNSTSEAAVWGAVAGGLLGAVIGGAAGASHPGTRWERVRLRQPAIAPRVAAGGLGVAVTLPL